MGTPIARRLLQVGYVLNIYDKIRRPMDALEREGALPMHSPRELGASSDLILLSLPDGEAAKNVISGEDGVLSGTRKGAIILDTSTTGPSCAKEMFELVQKRGASFLEAPVSGGPEKAATGTLSIMVGGDREVLDESMMILKALGKDIFYMGGPGTGQATKLVNQILVALNYVASCEALLFAASQGLDLKLIRSVIEASAGDSAMFRRAAPQIVSGSYGQGIQTYLIHKDLGLVFNANSERRVPLLMSSFARELFAVNINLGNADVDAASVMQVFEKLSGLNVKIG
jgi:3-hydroxyisobutyrate dehydrogenase-like beta-hydroxyacid dehydrogenase